MLETGRSSWYVFGVTVVSPNVSLTMNCLGLYRGVDATIIRASMLTATQMACYDHAKYYLRQFGFEEGYPLHLTYAFGDMVDSLKINIALSASIACGLISTTVCAPADVVKSRVMNDKSRRSAGHAPLYANSLDCLVKTFKTDGPLALMRGWLPSYLRIGPHFIIVWCILCLL